MIQLPLSDPAYTPEVFTDDADCRYMSWLMVYLQSPIVNIMINFLPTELWAGRMAKRCRYFKCIDASIFIFWNLFALGLFWITGKASTTAPLSEKEKYAILWGRQTWWCGWFLSGPNCRLFAQCFFKEKIKVDKQKTLLNQGTNGGTDDRRVNVILNRCLLFTEGKKWHLLR